MDDVQQLSEALAAGDAQAVAAILSAAPPLARAHTDDGWPMLHLAATPEVAALLLDAGADIDAPNRHKAFGPGNKPLHAAVYQARPDVVALLIERGADVNATDHAGWTPLHMAVANGRLDLARRLLEAGADPNARIGTREGQAWSGQTPLSLLTVENRTGEGTAPASPEVDDEMRRLLIDHGATA